MSSAAVHAPLFDAIKLVSLGSLIPTCIPTGPDGTFDLTPQWLSIRYGFDVDSLWLETDVVDPETRNVLYSIYVQPETLDNNARVWKLKPGRYRVYGLSKSMNASTVLLTSAVPPHSALKPPYFLVSRSNQVSALTSICPILLMMRGGLLIHQSGLVLSVHLPPLLKIHV